MQPDRATNNGSRTIEVVAAAPRCQLLLIVLMAAMLLPGMKVSPLLVWRKITRTIRQREEHLWFQETDHRGGKRKKKKKCLQGTRTTTKSDFEIFKRMTGSLNDDSTWTKVVQLQCAVQLLDKRSWVVEECGRILADQEPEQA
ncbi:hypothetical protein STEG23_027493, partial [Scotinomys teguina]